MPVEDAQKTPIAVTLCSLPRVLATQEYQKETVPLATGPCNVLLVTLQGGSLDDAYLVLSISNPDKKDDVEIVVPSEQVSGHPRLAA